MSLRITSGSLNITIGQPVDLEILYEFISLDKYILGVKFEDSRKGQTSNTNTFYNQITFNCFFHKAITVKVFKNGNINVSGITHKNQGIEVAMYIIDKMISIKGEKDIKITNINNVLYDTEDLAKTVCKTQSTDLPKSKPSVAIKMYQIQENNYVIPIGVKRKENFTLYNQKAFIYNQWFFTKTENCFIFKVYTLQGIYKGTATDIFTQKYKTNVSNRYKHVAISEKEIHFYTENDKYRGKRVFDFDILIQEDSVKDNLLLKRKYKCLGKDIEKIHILSCFLNYQDNLYNSINKAVLHNFFKDQGWDATYQMVGKVSKVILCLEKYKNIGDFKAIKVVFYSSGKVNIHSCSDELIVNKVYKNLLSLIKGCNEVFYNTTISVTNKNISIIDII